MTTKNNTSNLRLIELDTNTIAYMTAALEQLCRQLPDNIPGARAHIATRLEECARAGGKSMDAFNHAARGAIDELTRKEEPPTKNMWDRFTVWSKTWRR